jgi:phosphatidylglycerol:prolipoprotein diacylglycerol transferase
MFPYLIEIGAFRLPTYGVLVAAAFLAALAVTNRLAKRAGLDPERVLNLAMYCAVAGIVGAKIAMILEDLDYYASRPLEIFSLSTLQAAGIFYGGLIGALLVAWWYMRKAGLPLLATADVFAPGVALGHGVGRLGCFAAGCCWGTQCERPWAVTFTSKEAHDLVGVPLDIPLHPTQLYEAGAEFAIFGFLLWRIGNPHRNGAIIGWYLVLYSCVRFAVDFLRRQDEDARLTSSLTNAQWVSLALIAFAVLNWIRLRNRPAM